MQFIKYGIQTNYTEIPKCNSKVERNYRNNQQFLKFILIMIY